MRYWIRLILWVLVLALGFFGVLCLRFDHSVTKRFQAEVEAVPCEFHLDATQPTHLRIPFHHGYEGLHGCVLYLREEKSKFLKFQDASFLEFSLLDGDTVVVEGDNSTPCKEIWSDSADHFSGTPFAYLWHAAPHLPYQDYTLEVEVKTPQADPACADLSVVVHYHPCSMVLLGGFYARIIGIVSGGLALILALGVVVWQRRRPAE